MNWQNLNSKFIVCIGCLLFFSLNLFAEDYDTSSHSEKEIISVDEVYLQKWEERHTQKKELDKHLYNIDSLPRQKEGQTQFSYYLLSGPIVNKEYKTCLIYEYYESEMAVWLVNYSFENKIIDYLEIYYDNAEGAWQTTSTLNRETMFIHLEEYDAYADPEMKTIIYKILPSGKIEKINN